MSHPRGLATSSRLPSGHDLEGQHRAFHILVKTGFKDPKKMKIIQNTFGGVKCASKFTIFQHLQTLYSKTYYITMDLTSFTPVQKSP